MLPIDWATLLSTAPNIVTAVAFGFFVLRLLDRQDKQTEKRDSEWRVFLTESRKDYIESVTKIAAEVKSLSLAVLETSNAVSQHDTWSKTEAIRTDAVRSALASTQASEVSKFTSELSQQISDRVEKLLHK